MSKSREKPGGSHHPEGSKGRDMESRGALFLEAAVLDLELCVFKHHPCASPALGLLQLTPDGR